MEQQFHPAANLFPLLEGPEFEALAADIREHGLREPIWLHQDGRVLDGRNRYRACGKAGVEPRFQTYIGPDHSILPFVVSLNLRRRHLNESQRAMVAARLASMKQGTRTDLASIDAMSQPEAAKHLNVSRPSVQRAKQVLGSGCEALVEAVDQGQVAVADAAAVTDLSQGEQEGLLRQLQDRTFKNLKAARRRVEIRRQKEAIEAGNIELPEGVFEVLVVDPPWPYGNQDSYDTEGFRSTCPYPEESIQDLAARKLPAAENCVLWLWTTHLFMRHAFTLLDAWGFQEKAILTWVKDRMGTGRWLRSQSEFCIMAINGKPRVDLTNQTSLLHAPLREHSRKPDEFYKLVEGLCVGRRLDYFSRESRPGWGQFGNDTAKFKDSA